MVRQNISPEMKLIACYGDPPYCTLQNSFRRILKSSTDVTYVLIQKFREIKHWMLRWKTTEYTFTLSVSYFWTDNLEYFDLLSQSLFMKKLLDSWILLGFWLPFCLLINLENSVEQENNSCWGCLYSHDHYVQQCIYTIRRNQMLITQLTFFSFPDESLPAQYQCPTVPLWGAHGSL